MIIKISLLNDEVQELKYIQDILDLEVGIEYQIKPSKKVSIIFIDSSQKTEDELVQLVNRIIIDVILTFYKFKFLNSNISRADKESLEYFAFIGALLAFDYDSEVVTITRQIERVEEHSISGLFNFCLDKLKSNWYELAILANKLASRSLNTSDMYELTSYLLGVETYSAPIVKLDSANKKIFSNDNEIPIPQFTEEDDKNFVMAIVRARPYSITISDTTLVTENLLDAIKSLGEAKLSQ